MTTRFERIFDSLPVVSGDQIYSVAPSNQESDLLIGKDNEGRACVLLSRSAGTTRPQSPIRLQYLDAQFGVRAQVKSGPTVSEGTFTIIKCKSPEDRINRFFLSSVEAISAALVTSNEGTVARAISRLAIIFQQLTNPPTRSLNGLFGELFIINESRSPVAALRGWRLESTSRFDFTVGDFRLDAKTSSGRLRLHDFSYEQCNPPPGTVAFVASLFVERIAGSATLRALIDEAASKVALFPDLVFKLYETVATTLGDSLDRALSVGFDLRLARASLSFYDLRAVPAIRGALPLGVGDVHFRSDLSALAPIARRELTSRYSDATDLLPEFR